jgi:hypothetical protein
LRIGGRSGRLGGEERPLLIGLSLAGLAAARCGYRIKSAGELLPALNTALAGDVVSAIGCPVDYTANTELIRSLGDLDESLS